MAAGSAHVAREIRLGPGRLTPPEPTTVRFELEQYLFALDWAARDLPGPGATS